MSPRAASRVKPRPGQRWQHAELGHLAVVKYLHDPTSSVYVETPTRSYWCSLRWFTRKHIYRPFDSKET